MHDVLVVGAGRVGIVAPLAPRLRAAGGRTGSGRVTVHLALSSVVPGWGADGWPASQRRP